MLQNTTIRESPESGFCPTCGNFLYPEGNGIEYNGYEGSFVKCPGCGKVFANIRVGSCFTVGTPMKACTVYEIVAMHESPQELGAPIVTITCIEKAKVNCSALAKVNSNYYQYFGKGHVLAAMRGHFRKELI